MLRSDRVLGTVSISMLALAVAGCGGGGGEGSGGGGGGSPTPMPEPLSINANNARAISADVYAMTVVTGDLLDITGVARSAGYGEGMSAVELVNRVMTDELGGASQIRTTYQETYSCLGGGYFTEVDVDADDSGGISTGDSARVTFSGCVEDGVTLNGALGLLVHSFSDGTNFRVSASFDNLSISSGTERDEIDGEFTLAMGDDGTTESYRVTSSGLSVASGGETSRTTSLDQSGTARYSSAIGGYVYTDEASAIISNSAWNGRVSYQTPQAFESNDDGYAYYPHSGSLVITGANNTSVTVTATSSTMVQIDVDSTGDGVVDRSESISWLSLIGS